MHISTIVNRRSAPISPSSGTRTLRLKRWLAYIHIAIIHAAIFIIPAFAETSTTVGLSTGSNTIPFEFGTAITRYQQIYDGSNFSDSLLITSLDFFDTPEFGEGIIRSFDYSITLSTTTSSATNFSFVFQDNLGLDAQLFASGSFSGVLSGELLTFHGTGFSYNPNEGNLLLDILFSNIGSDTEDHDGMEFTESPLFPTQRIYSHELAALTGTTGCESEYIGHCGLTTRFNGTIVPVPVPFSGNLILLPLLGLFAFAKTFPGLTVGRSHPIS